MKIKEKEKIFAYLEKNGFLEYGKIIPKEEFENMFDVKFKEGDWDFLGPLLHIQVYLIENGYLCTQENVEPGCLRIYDCDEIAYKSDKIFRNMVKSLKRLQSCMVNTKIQEFNNTDFQKHMHATNKITTALHSLTSKLSRI